MATRFRSMYQYVIELAKFDNDYKLRDYARLLENSLDKDGEVYATLKEVLLSDKAAPQVTRNTDEPSDLEIGTCSYFFNHTFSSYDKLPEWNVLPVNDARRYVANTSPTSELTSQNVLEKDDHSNSESIFSAESSSSSSSELSESSEADGEENNSDDEESSDEEESYSTDNSDTLSSSSSSSSSLLQQSTSFDASSQTASDDSTAFSDNDREHISKSEHNQSTSSSKSSSSSRVHSSESPSATSEFAPVKKSVSEIKSAKPSSPPLIDDTQVKTKSEQNKQSDKNDVLTSKDGSSISNANDVKSKEKPSVNDKWSINDSSTLKQEKDQAESKKTENTEKFTDVGKHKEQITNIDTNNTNEDKIKENE